MRPGELAVDESCNKSVGLRGGFHWRGVNPVVRVVWGSAEEGLGDLPRIGCLVSLNHLSLDYSHFS